MCRGFLKQQKKVARGEIEWIERVGCGSHAIFGQKLLNTQHSVGGALVNHSSWKRQMCWVFKKNSLKPNAASPNNASWYTNTNGFLEHSPTGGSLYYPWHCTYDNFRVFGVPLVAILYASNFFLPAAILSSLLIPPTTFFLHVFFPHPSSELASLHCLSLASFLACNYFLSIIFISVL